VQLAGRTFFNRMNADHSERGGRSLTMEGRRWLIGGLVQGVGYRGYVFNLAQRLGLSGAVKNLTGEVLVEAQGDACLLDAFAHALVTGAPPLARPHVIGCESVPLKATDGFHIMESEVTERPQIRIPVDRFLCNDCREEMLEPKDRRYQYPFINCTQCGPRYTLITRMPYDRPNTTMAMFEMCARCRAEYEDPHNRRFHAQPIACPACGPQLAFVSEHQSATRDAALDACVAALNRGEVVAVKGVGGYHLMCDATNGHAIRRLRGSKFRPDKPLAVMFPMQGNELTYLRAELQLDASAQATLCDTSRPIVIVPRSFASRLPDEIAPGLRDIGAMLPYSPLHHLLLEGFGKPVVATSGNISGEPVLTESADAEARLSGVTHAFLHHDRPIARPADDSVIRVIAGKPRLLRAGRGIAPLEFEMPFKFPRPLLAVGGHMKNTIALGWDSRAVLSPHIGDLDSPRSMEIFEQVIVDLQRLYGVSPEAIACDMHAGYASSRWAAGQGLPLYPVQHHRAHAAALSFEAGLDKLILAFTWDGVGLGDDRILWGGEALLGRPGSWKRTASFSPFHVPGGEAAARQPWRSAAAVCWERGFDWRSDAPDVALLKKAWKHGLNSPETTSVGRLFDAASSLLGLCHTASYEGQGPMLLEAAALGDPGSPETDAVVMPNRVDGNGLLRTDWEPLMHAMRRREMPVPQRARLFHTSLARCLAAQAKHIHEIMEFDIVGLTGGVFQNKLLSELASRELMAAGFEVHLPDQLPCNDGGLALGQLIEAATTPTP
jgi:hydrogenase maturation protein HypF